MSSSAASTRQSTTMTRIASPPTVLGPHPGPDSCDLCGASELSTELVRDPFIYGTDSDAVELSADVPVHTCSQCEVSYTGKEAEIARHEAVCRHLGLLTPAEIRGLRKRYDLSRAAFARVTGFGEATLARWESGEVIQNTSSDRYLRLLMDPSVMNRLPALTGFKGPTGRQRRMGPSVAVQLVVLTPQVQNRYRRRARTWNPRRGVA